MLNQAYNYSSWSPKKFANLEIDLVPHIESTLTKSANYVSEVSELSINREDCTQFTGANQPLWQNNKELYFDGTNDCLNMNAVATYIASATASTFFTWIKIDESEPPTYGRSLGIQFGKENADSFIGKWLHAPSGKVIFFAKEAGVYKWWYETQTAPLTDLTWSSVCGVADGTTIKIYIDGVAVSMNAVNTTDLTWNFANGTLDTCTIGKRRSNSNDYGFTNGAYGRSIVWGSALTASEVLEVHNATKGVYL